MLLDKIYQKLYDDNVCDSRYEFSTRFLGRSRSYYSVIKAKKLEPSISAISILETSLLNEADLYRNGIPVLEDIRSTLIKLSMLAKEYREIRCKQLLNDKNYSETL